MKIKSNKKITKTLVIIDYANIKSWLREKGLGIDLKILKQALVGIGIKDIRFYYGTDNKNLGIKKFFEIIEKFGFVLITKPVQYFKIKLSELMQQRNNTELVNKLSKKLRLSFVTEVNNLEKKGLVFLQPKANFDVEITVDVLERVDEYNNFILFSGDGDFVPLVEKLQKKEKWVVAVSGRKYFSGQLMYQVDSFVTMERLIDVISGLTYSLNAKTARRRLLKKCTFSIATLNRLSSLLYKSGDKK